MLLNSQKHKPTSFKVIPNNYNISPKDGLKYLGVLFDNKLNWKPHGKKVKTQQPRACGVLSKLEHYITQSVLKAVYNSLIQPYLTYSIIKDGRASNATIQPLINIQNKAIKVIRPTKQTSLEESFQHLTILGLPKLYALPLGICMHSYYNKLLPYHFDDYFNPTSSIYSNPSKLSISNNVSRLFFRKMCPYICWPKNVVFSPRLR